jgi:hypothetical protein
MAFMHVAASITHLVPVEVIEGPFSTLRMGTNVSMMRIEAVINVPVEVARAVEPRACSDEHPTAEPLRTIVSVRRAVVRGIVIEAIRTGRLGSDIDRDLSRCGTRNARQSGDQGRQDKKFRITHLFLLIFSSSRKKQTKCQIVTKQKDSIQHMQKANVEHMPKIEDLDLKMKTRVGGVL